MLICEISCSDSNKTEGVAAIRSDNVELIDGLNYSILIKWGDEISENHYFGYGNAHIELIESESSADPQIWVSHEQVNTLFVSGYSKALRKSRQRSQIRKELYQTGGSLVKIRKANSGWEVVLDPRNVRITGAQNIPFEWHEPIRNQQSSFGTIANSNGGMTPWQTILTCERDFSYYYGDRDFNTKAYQPSDLMWESFLSKPTEHYGWVVEFDPATREMKKHIGLGRFAHGAAHTVSLPDGKVVIYSGDTRAGGMLYKYISDTPNRIYPGSLYVANMKNKVWRPLDYAESQLNANFSDETDMFIHTREASFLIGGTELESPIGIVTDPKTGDLMIAIKGNDSFGEIMRFKELNGDYTSMEFDFETFIEGGKLSDFANPSILRFDPVGNLWFTTDMPLDKLNDEDYKGLGNNGLYVFPKGEARAIRVATSPMEASFSGLGFSADFETVFVSVNHPGALSTVKLNTSHWPEGGESVPKPAVITLQGNFLKELKNQQ